MPPTRLAAFSRTALVALLVIGTTAPATAVDVRQGDAPARWHAQMTRAFAPCLAPNDVARNGTPACNPPVTSACGFREATITIESNVPGAEPNVTLPRGTISFTPETQGVPPECLTDDYFVDVTVRVTADHNDLNGLDPACAGGRCTFADRVARERASGSFFLLDLPTLDHRDASFEILHAVIIAPDGLPLATTGVAANGTAGASANLTIPYAPCADDVCIAAPRAAACDFESGGITWFGASSLEAASVRATLRDVGGTSPLCATGTYQVETTVRATLPACGSPFAPEPCTLVDTTVMVPLAADGRHLDATGTVRIGSLGQYEDVEILSARVLDPTGAAIAGAGVTGVRDLAKPRVAIVPGQLRLQALLPVDAPDLVIDPLLEGGATILLSDRDGPIYGVTIPSERWQLLPPIGSRWTYKDPGAVLNGVRKASLKRVGKVGAGKGYKLDLLATGVDLSGADAASLDLSVVVARPSPAGFYRAQRNRTCVVKASKLSCK